MSNPATYTVLSGGVGGAKLVLGLQQVLAPGQLRVIANTGDDFVHLGLPISPDIDTLLYTLSGQANPESGWGRRDETWSFMAALAELGGETWFQLGDKDLATHVMRRELLQAGLTLSQATARLAASLGVATPVLPMSDDPVRTRIATRQGELDFQDYFVRRQAQPVATAIRYAGSDTARPAQPVVEALNDPATGAIIISPSNPWLSVAPILAISELQSAIKQNNAPVVAVSPVVAGQAIKGPTAKLMAELGIARGVTGIADHYRGLIDGLIIDTRDAAHRAEIETLGLKVSVTNTVMDSIEDKQQLAEHVIRFAADLRVNHS